MSTPYPKAAPSPAQPPAAAPAKPPKTFADRFARFVLYVVVVGVLGFAAYTWITLHYTYSEGERVGYARKLSNKGWICKTWEGEMAMVTMPGTVAEKFFFTVRDDSVADDINRTVGSRVVLSYDEHKWVPFSCFGDTGHIVTGVKSQVEDPT